MDLKTRHLQDQHPLLEVEKHIQTYCMQASKHQARTYWALVDSGYNQNSGSSGSSTLASPCIQARDIQVSGYYLMLFSFPSLILFNMWLHYHRAVSVLTPVHWQRCQQQEHEHQNWTMEQWTVAAWSDDHSFFSITWMATFRHLVESMSS